MENHINIDIKNRELFKKKDLLRKIYTDYFIKVKQNLNISSTKPSLEIGSSGFIKSVIPNCITSNLKRYDKQIDLEENVYSLNIDHNSLSNIIMIDIFHHLEFPKLAIKKMFDALEEGGKIIMIEPSMGLIPRLIYKVFHHEPNGFDINIKWNEVPNEIPGLNSYFAAQSVPWRAFVKREFKFEDQFILEKIECFSDFAFLCSGGFSFKSFYPSSFYKFMKFFDYILSKISYRIFSARMIVVLKKIKK